MAYICIARHIQICVICDAADIRYEYKYSDIIPDVTHTADMAAAMIVDAINGSPSSE